MYYILADSADILWSIQSRWYNKLNVGSFTKRGPIKWYTCTLEWIHIRSLQLVLLPKINYLEHTFAQILSKNYHEWFLLHIKF